jgi:integrase
MSPTAAMNVVAVIRLTPGTVIRRLTASEESINKTITRVGQILEVALEREVIARNPVRVNPRKRKLKAAKARPVHLDGADRIIALLDAARELDVAPKSRTSGRLALIATLLFAGARDDEIGHALARDLDLARRRLEVGRSKTAAGMRTIDLLPVLHDVLAEYKASRPETLDDLLFTTARGQRRDKDNINKRASGPPSNVQTSCSPSGASTLCRAA